MVRRLRSWDRIVRQQELSHLLTVEGLFWLDGILFETLRLRVGIGVEDRPVHGPTPRPEPATAHLVRVRFARHKFGQVGRAWVRGRRAAGESGDRQVKSPPEEVHWAHLADEPRAKLREHTGRLRQNRPAPLYIFRILGRMV